MTPFEQVLKKYRETSFSERDKGYRFEKLMKAFLQVYPLYEGKFASVWLWNEFPSRGDFGSGDKDLGIDLVAKTKEGDYWAVQCKCYQEDVLIDKPKVDTFLSTSGKSFYERHAAFSGEIQSISSPSPTAGRHTEEASSPSEPGKKINFAFRLWIDTTKKGFNSSAEATIKDQKPPVGRLGYFDLLKANVDWLKLAEGKKADVKKYDPKLHQQTAIDDVHNYLKAHDR